MTATETRGERRVRIDPRLAARRARVERRRGTRRLTIIAVLTVLATVAIGAITASKSPLLDVESVTVTGADRADERQIATASGLVIGAPLLEVDTDGVIAAVERVPWVETATVDRRWDGTVAIAVTERVGVAALPTGARHVVVDRSGRQLEVVEVPPPSFVPIRGVAASGVPGQSIDDDARSAVTLVDALSPGVRKAVTEVVVVDGALTATLVVGGHATFGDTRQLDAKMVALETMLIEVDLSCLAEIDLTAPSAPTLRRTTPASPAAAQPGPANEEPDPGVVGC